MKQKYILYSQLGCFHIHAQHLSLLIIIISLCLEYTSLYIASYPLQVLYKNMYSDTKV